MTTREIDPTTISQRAAYLLLTSLVVPRPIAWVSTLAADGTRNLAPHSYFNIISSEPPVVHFTSAGEKDTLRNVRATGEFVVNLVTPDLAEQMNTTSANFPPDEDEFSWAGLEAAPSVVVKPPRVLRSRVAMECVVHSQVTIGTGTMVFGRVVHIAVDEGVLDGDRVLPHRLRTIARLGGSAYTRIDTVFKMPRPTWDEVRDR